jgi:hypothetical protein
VGCSGIFRDKRGHFHILGHWFKNGKGGHAFSRNGIDWTFAGDAYDGDLKWDDGMFSSQPFRYRHCVAHRYFGLHNEDVELQCICCVTGTHDNLGRRERPQVLVIKGEPAVLFTGASMDRLGGMSHTFTLAQAIATDTPPVNLY